MTAQTLATQSLVDRVAVRVAEVRVLEGPNLYFARPAIKVSLELPGYLSAETQALSGLATRIGMRRWRPGAPGSEQRQRYAVRLVERAVRVLAAASGTSRLGVRTRAGNAPELVVCAYVWRDRGRGEALGAALGPLLTEWLQGGDGAAVVLAHGQQISAARTGEKPAVAEPRIPVASVTGTNGKTTTTRLLAHIGMTAGLRTAWSSTDGVLAQGEMVEPGDFSGPAGARAVLVTPGVQLGVLETARGGMLLKGMGVASNDVSIVTNVSADHLGMHGIDTLDQLAEVKAIVTTVTRPGGWAVLNGDDPRVWAMRTKTRARPWAFSLDPNSPSLREAMDCGGRGVTVLDGDIAVLVPGRDADRLVHVVDVPATLAGLSRHNMANVLAAAAAALGLGLPRHAVVEGLKTFQPDARMNFGRLNTFTLPRGETGSVTVIMDLAHNEAGLEALMDVARGLTAPGGRVHLGLGLAGDRSDELLESIGEVAGRRADVIVAVHKEHYLRGRTMAGLEQHLRAGLSRVGVGNIDSYRTELDGLEGLVRGAAAGDVVALMCHAEREQVVAWLERHGASADDAHTIRRKVIAARGEHQQEPAIAALRTLADPAQRVAAARALHEQDPSDPRLSFEYAGTLERADLADVAMPLYRSSLEGGLQEPHRHRAVIHLASCLRVTGRAAEAAAILTELAAERPGDASVVALRALALSDLGRDREAVGALVDALMQHATDEDAQGYRPALTAYAAALREASSGARSADHVR